MTASNRVSFTPARPSMPVLLPVAIMLATASIAVAQPAESQAPAQTPIQAPTQAPAQAPTSSPAQPGTPAPAPAAPKAPEPLRNTKEWNLGKNNLAIDGYDPVAYHPEFGGTATPGSDKIVLNYKGVVYRFASDANRQEFQRDPSKYEPAHGGWCSWAVKDADKVEIDPKSFIVKDGRLFLFYKGFFGDTRARWLKLDHAAQVKQADDQWKKLSNENPHLPTPPSAAAEKPSPETKPAPDAPAPQPSSPQSSSPQPPAGK